MDECVRMGLSDKIQVEDQGTLELKGKSQPVHVYSLKPF